MTELAQHRISFFERLHEGFLMRKGHGAFAYITVSEAVNLFESFLESAESEDTFIDRFVRAI